MMLMMTSLWSPSCKAFSQMDLESLPKNIKIKPMCSGSVKGMLK